MCFGTQCSFIVYRSTYSIILIDWSFLYILFSLSYFIFSYLAIFCCKCVIKRSVQRSLTLLIFAVGWALCGRPKSRHESIMLLLLLKLYPLPGNIFRKRFASYFLFIHEQLVSNCKSYCCNGSFTNVMIISLLTKNI